MPTFSEMFCPGLSQHELDFVDVSNEFDTPVYVDPYAIEICNDIWAEEASEHIRTFFKEILDALRAKNSTRAIELMSHLHEPAETFLGVSRAAPQKRGLGPRQSAQLIQAIRTSKAFKSGILSDLSEMALYVEGIDRDKISDLTTNVIRKLLVTYTQQQCELHDVPTRFYSGPPVWDIERLNWISMHVKLPFIGDNATMLVPKYIVRRKLSLDSQEFYNKQITDFLVAETLRANTSLVRTIKGRKKVLKTEVRQEYPKDKQFIADLVFKHPELLSTYKEIARAHKSLTVFRDDFDQVTVTTACANLATLFSQISPGTEDADKYHNLILGSFTALFYPNLIQPHKEWEIHGRRKRIDVVFANAADSGFFAHRRNDPLTHANTVIVECKNYSSDLANPELDQLIGRFDNNRGKFGIIACRSIDNPELLLERVRDAASRSQGYIIVLTDEDIIAMLSAKASLKDDEIEALLFRKFRDLVA